MGFKSFGILLFEREMKIVNFVELHFMCWLTYDFPLRNDRIQRAMRLCTACDQIDKHTLGHCFDSEYLSWCRWLFHRIPDAHKRGSKVSVGILRTYALQWVWIDSKWIRSCQMPPSTVCNRFHFVGTERCAMLSHNWDTKHWRSAMHRQLS